MRLSELPMSQTTDFSAGNLVYAEAQYERYLADPQSVDRAWQDLFESWTAELDGSISQVGPSFSARSIYDPAGTSVQFNGNTNGQPGQSGRPVHIVPAPPVAGNEAALQHRVVVQMFHAYPPHRKRRHQIFPAGDRQ